MTIDQLRNNKVIRLVLITISAFLYSIAVNIFTESGNLFPGGFAGLSLLITRSLSSFAGINIPFAVPYWTLNAVVTLIVFKYMGKKFACLSIFWYSLTSIFTTFIPVYAITQDILLISVFGGLLAGFAIGIALRNNASSGGLDFLAIYTSSKFNRSTWSMVLLINCIILGLAGVIFGWDKALYSIIYQFCSNQVVNLMHDRYKLKNLMIVTRSPDEVAKNIFKRCRHGITKLNAEGMYSHISESILVMTINAYQLHDVIAAVKEADEKAFIQISSAEKIYGNYYQKPLE